MIETLVPSSEAELAGLTQDVRHLVLKVLCCNERVQEFPASLNHGVDLSTASSQMRVIVEGLPEVVNGLAPWLGTGVDEDAYFGLRAVTLVGSPTINTPNHVPPACGRWH